MSQLAQPLKKFSPIYVVLFTVLFSSCAKEDSPDPRNDSQSFCMKQETNIYQDGYHIGKTLHNYDGKLLTSEVTYDAFNGVTDSAHYTYNQDGAATRKYYYNFANNIQQETTIEYNADGNEIFNQHTINGSVLSSMRMFRSNEGRIDSLHSNINGLVSRHFYTYEGNRVTLITEISLTGDTLKTRNYTYEGNMLTLTIKDQNDKMVNRTVIISDDEGRETDLTIYDASDEILSRKLTEYDSKGNVIEITNIYPGHGTYVYQTTWMCD